MAKRVVFGKLMRNGYRKSREAARRQAYDYARRFKRDWEARFGDDDKIAGPSGVPGTAEPLSAQTIQNRIARGWYGTGMLYDPELPHVSEGEGTIKDSIEMTDVQTRQRGFYTEVWYGVYTAHPKFPLNEFGLGVPVRATLAPTGEAIGPDFAEELHKEYENILTRREGL